MSTKQILDQYYNPEVQQILIIGGIFYKHFVNGEWFIIDE